MAENKGTGFIVHLFNNVFMFILSDDSIDLVEMSLQFCVDFRTMEKKAKVVSQEISDEWSEITGFLCPDNVLIGLEAESMMFIPTNVRIDVDATEKILNIGKPSNTFGNN